MADPSKCSSGAAGLGHIRIYSKFEYEDERICEIRILKRPIFVGRSTLRYGGYDYCDTSNRLFFDYGGDLIRLNRFNQFWEFLA